MIQDFIGYFAAVCTTVAIIPQVVKAYRSRHTKDLSYGMYGLSGLGVAAWLIYGWMVHDTPLLLANLISFVFISSILVLKVLDGD